MRSAKTSVALFVFWCVVVPPESLLDLVVGAGIALMVGLWASRYLWPELEHERTGLQFARLPGFVLRMAGRVVVASFQVLVVVIDPRLPISPEVIRQEVRFGADVARTTYANAITITPGTLTLDVEGDTFVVHCLDRRLAGTLLEGRLAREVEALFDTGRRS